MLNNMMPSKTHLINIMLVIGFLDLFGVSIVYPLISKHVRDLGASPTVAGLLGSVYGGLQLFSNPLVGQWSDLRGRRHVLVCCLLLSAFGYCVLGMSSTLLLLLFSRIILGMFKCSQEQCRAYLADSCEKSEHSTVFGRFNAVSSLGFIVGPTIGGHIAEYPGGFYICALLCATSFFLCTVLVWLFVPEIQKKTVEHERDRRGTPWKNPLAGLLSFSEWAPLWDVFLVRFLMGLGIMAYRNNFNMWLDYKFGISPSLAGYLTSYTGLVGTLSGFGVGYVTQFYSHDSKLLLHTGYIQVLSIFLMLFVTDTIGLVLCMAPLSLANACARVASTNVLLERGQGQKTGSMIGVGASVLSLARMGAPLLGGLAQEYSTDGPVITGAVCCLAGVIIMKCIESSNKATKYPAGDKIS